MKRTARLILTTALVWAGASGIALVTEVDQAALQAEERQEAGGDQHFGPARDQDFRHPPEAVVRLGQMLFFDKILSGNRNISCATCHSPVVATVDGLSINIGTGGEGLAVLRDAGTGAVPPLPRDPHLRGSRNMTPLFNLGHEQFTKLFWDGRVQVDPSFPQGFRTPALEDLPYGFDHALDALSIFAETDRQEMRGEPGTNEVADAAAANPDHPQIAIWNALVARVVAIPEYVDLFGAAFPNLRGNPKKISIVHVGTAIGAFQAAAFRSDNSPFDRYLRGDTRAMSDRAAEGMQIFYGRAGCASCHSGVFQTDMGFHAIGMPQIGPGFGDGVGGHEDFGREGVTGDPADRYRIRTPSLRNVVLTGPWGHDGAFNSLRAVIEHHLDPVMSLQHYDRSQAVLPSRPDLDALDFIALDDPGVTASIVRAIEIEPQPLSDYEIDRLLDFMEALTDPSAGDLRKTVPKRVPSGLPLAETRGF